MTDTDLLLAEGFDGRNEQQWRAAIDKVLKGGDFEKRLVSKTADGISLQPLYMQASAGSAVTSARGARPWEIAQRVDHPDPSVANKLALEDLEGGANSLVLIFEDSKSARGFGLPISNREVLAATLKDIALDMISLRLEAGASANQAAQDLAAIISDRGLTAETLNVHFALSPIASLMSNGGLTGDWTTTASDLAATISQLSNAGFKGPFITCDARPVSEAGGSEAQELAVAIASAVEYLRAQEANGIALDAAAKAISFTMPIDAGQFEGTAKLRALRKLWSRIQEATGLTPHPAHIHAETAWRMVTKRDAAVNMLRSTLATFTAGIAGADSLTVLPHSIALGLPDAFARRVARNTQNVLIEESNLWRVVDPSAGTGSVEALTDELCQSAWALFQDIEREGGIVESLTAGHVQARIAGVAADRAKRLASRREAITGTSEFPLLSEEKSSSILDIPSSTGRQTASLAFTIEPLQSARLAEPFEALRDAADAHAAKSGQRASVFLANLGALAEHTARATWIKNLLAVGGIDVITNEGFTQSGDVGHAFAQSGANIACICSSDTNYELLGEATAQALKSAGASHVILAGKPTAALETSGVNTFLHVGVDVLAELQDLHAKLGLD